MQECNKGIFLTFFFLNKRGKKDNVKAKNLAFSRGYSRTQTQ